MTTHGKSGIPITPTWEVLDASKIQDYMACPRGFFFKHILGFKSAEANIHLVFGAAWHEAMAYLLDHKHPAPNAYPAHLTLVAHNEHFAPTFRESFPDEIFGVPTDSLKTIGRGLKALSDYTAEWRRDDFNVLHTEIAFTVPIFGDRLIWGKMDSILEDASGIWSMEHKTTQRQTKAWENCWSTVFQVGCYTHGLYMLYPREMVVGVKINGLVLNYKKNKFLRLHETRSDEQMLSWLGQAKRYISTHDLDLSMLADCSPSDRHIGGVFPVNGENCRKFGCRYQGLCELANPLQNVPQWIERGPPPGYCVEHWDPRERFKDKKQVHLETSTAVIEP